MSSGQSALRHRSILLVCTGNTCRSPMAAALLRTLLVRRLGSRAADVNVVSAGIHVPSVGDAATPNACKAMAERGLSLRGHRARQLDPDDLACADLILTMTRAHWAELRQRFPPAADRLFTLTDYTGGHAGAGRDIADPFGGDLDEYRACADQLEKELSTLVELIAGEEGCDMPTLEIVTRSGASLLETLPLEVQPDLSGQLQPQVEPELPVLLRIAVGADHAGYELKAELAAIAAELGCEIVDYGTDSSASCDYPDYAAKVAAAVVSGACDAGLLVCGTGLGMAIAANKVHGIRAVTANDLYCARLSRDHNDANVLCLGARVVGPGLAADILRTFVRTPFGGSRHVRRVRKIHDLEQSGEDRQI